MSMPFKVKTIHMCRFKEKWFFLYLHITSFGIVLKLLFETKKNLVQVLLPSIHFLIGF